MRLSIRLPLLIIVSESVTICIIILLLLFFIRNTVRETETAALTNSLKGYDKRHKFLSGRSTLSDGDNSAGETKSLIIIFGGCQRRQRITGKIHGSRRAQGRSVHLEKLKAF